MDILDQILSKNKFWFISVSEVLGYVFMFSFIVFHFIIFIGRKNFKEGKLHLYFCGFFTGLLLYIFTDSFTFHTIIPKIINLKIWLVFIIAVSFLIIYKSIILLLNTLLNFPLNTQKSINRIFKYYTLFNLVWVAPLFFKIKHLFNYFWTVNFLFITSLAVVYIINFNKEYRKAENSTKIIVWLVLGYLLYIMLYRGSWIVFPEFSTYAVWIFNDALKLLVLFTFAYALAKKTNEEFTDLQNLKNNLEQKVDEKTRELKNAKEKIEEINEQRSQYFINVAHETKTPLTLISNYLDRFIKTKGNSRELRIIKENFDKLKNDMVHFLDIEKYEKGLVTYSHNKVIDLSEIIRQKMPLYEEFANLNNLKVIFDLKDNVFVQSDPSACERIINNLFENSVKYKRDSGEIFITLIKDNVNATLIVKDNGQGIEKEKLNNIFQPYYQISHSKQNSQGLGMGLYIVKNIVDSLNGTINVKSEVDKGCEITICLPGAIKNEHETGSVKNLGETVSINTDMEITWDEKTVLEKRTILIVEDNKDMRMYLIEELSDVFHVYSADNGKNALDLLKANSGIDLILSDVMMDEMDGYTFYDEVSKNEKHANIPFVFLTARSYDHEKIKMLTKGVSDYLYKPFSIEELKAKIWSVVQNASKQKMAGLKDAIQAVQNTIISNGKNGNEKLDILELRKKENKLTERQAEIILLIEQGLEYKQIADNLSISVKTVHRHVQNLFEKFKVHSKLELLKVVFD